MGAQMVPRLKARIEDLGPGDFVKVDCAAQLDYQAKTGEAFERASRRLFLQKPPILVVPLQQSHDPIAVEDNCFAQNTIKVMPEMRSRLGVIAPLEAFQGM